MVVVQHPPAEADGRPYYDLAQVRRNAEEILGGSALWAPVGPLVRQQLAGLASRPSLTKDDWHNVVDIERWRTVRRTPQATGRSSAATAGRIGANGRTPARRPSRPIPTIRASRSGCWRRALSSSWSGAIRATGRSGLRLRAARAVPASIDFFVYHHIRAGSRRSAAPSPRRWRAAGRGPAATFRALFGDGAIYAAPSEVVERARAVPTRPPTVARATRRELASRSSATRPTPARARADRAAGRCRGACGCGDRGAAARVLFISSNGVGMGHLDPPAGDRAALPAPIEPVFVAMSQAVQRGRGASAIWPSTCRPPAISAATSSAGTRSWPGARRDDRVLRRARVCSTATALSRA